MASPPRPASPTRWRWRWSSRGSSSRGRSRARPMYRIPILQMGQILLVTIQVDMQDQMALALQDDLATKISNTGAKGVVIDISALEIVDSFVGRMLASISGISRILGATTVV